MQDAINIEAQTIVAVIVIAVSDKGFDIIPAVITPNKMLEVIEANAKFIDIAILNK